MKLILRRCSRPGPLLTTAIFCSSFQPGEEGRRGRANKKSPNKPCFHSVLIPLERLFIPKYFCHNMFCNPEPERDYKFRKQCHFPKPLNINPLKRICNTLIMPPSRPSGKQSFKNHMLLLTVPFNKLPKVNPIRPGVFWF